MKKLAHHLNPVVFVGRQGITKKVVSKTEDSLSHHELIKIKFHDHQEDLQSMAELLSNSTHSLLVDIIGHIVILYRKNPDLQNQKI